MADLYNLLADDALLREENGEEPEETDVEASTQQPQGEEWDRDDREHIELPSSPELLGAPTEATLPSTTAADAGTPTSILDLNSFAVADDREPLELKDLQRDDPDELFQSYQRLRGLWTQELACPELLPYDADALAQAVDAVADQDDAAAEGSAATNTGNANLDGLLASVLRVDSGRCKFMLCHLLRERMRKMEAHPRHHKQNVVERMSPNELAFLNQYLALVDGHLHRTVLDHFPQEAWKKLDAPEMIDEPDLDAYVFARTTEDHVVVDDDDAPEPPRDKGTCLIVRYARIRDVLQQGKVELLL